MSKKITYKNGDIIKNNLVYIEESGFKYYDNGTRKRLVKVKCHCGNIFTTRLNDVRLGKTKSCGCYNIQKIKERSTKHGLSANREEHPLYAVWKGIKQRCLNPNQKQYRDYGGRGITICDEWKNNPKTFVDWCLTHGYKRGLEIDRIDVNGNYEPSNCRFTTRFVNSVNKRVDRSKNKTGYKGVSSPKPKRKQFSAAITVNGKRIYLGGFNTALEAAKAYDNYVIENKLEHSINGV